MSLKKFLIATTACVTLATSAFSFEMKQFFQATIGYWTITGHMGDAKSGVNPACVTYTTWKDGSQFYLIQDLADGELYVEFTNHRWNVQGPYGKDAPDLQLTINMYSGDRVVESWSAFFALVDKNTIQIRGIDFRKFIPGFVDMTKIVLIMPGNIPDAQVLLSNSGRAINYMIRCMQESDRVIDKRALEEFNKQKERGQGQDA